MGSVKWEKVGEFGVAFGKTPAEMFRMAVPGGWLVMVRTQKDDNMSITFMPDPEHEWDGRAL